jgi:hypothetical protein
VSDEKGDSRQVDLQMKKAASSTVAKITTIVCSFPKSRHVGGDY